MTVREWLGQRSPTPPAELSTRIEQTLGSRCDQEAGRAPELCISAAEELLRELLARPSSGRESALDLLTVDALVTYAFEAASNEPESLAERADDAMARFAEAARA